MKLKALARQTGSYGTVNEGDTVEVLDPLGEELVALGNFERTTSTNDTATPEEVSERNDSGLKQEPIHADGTNREVLNTEGRNLHDSGPDAIQEAAARAEADIAPEINLNQAPTSDEERPKKKK